MKQAYKSLIQLNLLCILALKSFPSHRYMYACIHNFNKQLPMDSAKEYYLNYTIPVWY